MKKYKENFGFNNFNKKKMLIIFSIYIFIFVLFLSVGFSAFQTTLLMKDISARILYDTDVRISDFRVESLNNSAVASNTEYDYNKVFGDLILENNNSSITYAVDVINLGNTKVGISNITGLTEKLDYTISGYTLRDPINEDGQYTLGVTMTFYITLKYAAGATATSEIQAFNLDFEFKEFHSVTYYGVPGEDTHPKEVMDGDNLVITTELTNIERMKITQDTVFLTYGEHYTYDETTKQLTVTNVTGDLLLSYRDISYLVDLTSDTGYYKEAQYRTTIKNISFVNYVDITDAIKTYDMSENQDQSIIGWITDNSEDEAGTYNLYIGSVYDIYTKNFASAFAHMTGVRNIDFKNLNTSQSTSFAYTFYQTDVTYLNLETFNTSSATSMLDMFADMDQLETLDVSNFNTVNVTNMWYMFGGTSKLTKLDISTFDTSNVTNMAHMFAGMTNLKELKLGRSFKTSNVTTMERMFSELNSLQSLDLSSFTTEKLLTTANMFYNCSSLTSLDLSSFKMASVTDTSQMFYKMNLLENLNISNFNTVNVQNMQEMFYGCSKLTNLDLSNFNTGSVSNMAEMFSGMTSLQSLDISDFNTISVIDMTGMFYNCSSLAELDVSSFDTSNVKTMTEMFSNMSSLQTLDLSNFRTPAATAMDNMFSYCTNLTSLNVTNFNTSNVKTMERMFYNLIAIETLDLNSFTTPKVTNMSYLFSNCRMLTNLDIRQMSFSKVTSSTSVFSSVPGTIKVIVADTDAQTWVRNRLVSGGTITLVTDL